MQDGSSEKVMCQHSAAMDNTSEERPDYTKAHIPRKSNNSRGIVVGIFIAKLKRNISADILSSGKAVCIFAIRPPFADGNMCSRAAFSPPLLFPSLPALLMRPAGANILDQA